MQQQTFADASFARYRKPTRRERFLDEMNRVVSGRTWPLRLRRCIQMPRALGAHPWASNACCACIASNSGSTCLVRL
jgi:hypothetical protein